MVSPKGAADSISTNWGGRFAHPSGCISETREWGGRIKCFYHYVGNNQKQKETLPGGALVPNTGLLKTSLNTFLLNSSKSGE